MTDQKTNVRSQNRTEHGCWPEKKSSSKMLRDRPRHHLAGDCELYRFEADRAMRPAPGPKGPAKTARHACLDRLLYVEHLPGGCELSVLKPRLRSAAQRMPWCQVRTPPAVRQRWFNNLISERPGATEIQAARFIPKCLDNQDPVEISASSFAKHLPVEDRACRRAVRKLEGEGWILVTRVPGRTNWYTINPACA